MAKWKKRFEAWQSAKQPIPKAEVESILIRVFGDRVTVNEGTSHQWIVDVSELQGLDSAFVTGMIVVPLSGGQVVKAPYCRLCYEAAGLLGLPEEEDEQDE